MVLRTRFECSYYFMSKKPKPFTDFHHFALQTLLSKIAWTHFLAKIIQKRLPPLLSLNLEEQCHPVMWFHNILVCDAPTSSF